MRSRDGGYLASFSAVRRGRGTSSPPQFGHLPPSTPSLHARQKVHSKEQMNASVDSGGRSRLQHSQFGRSCSIAYFGGAGSMPFAFNTEAAAGVVTNLISSAAAVGSLAAVLTAAA